MAELAARTFPIAVPVIARLSEPDLLARRTSPRLPRAGLGAGGQHGEGWHRAYPGCDEGRADCLRKMFKNTGIPEANFAIAKIRFAVKDKKGAVSAITGNKLTVNRLRYQLHTEAFTRGDQKLDTLLKSDDELHIVWIGHGQSVHYVEDKDGDDIDEYRSVKFAPHYNSDEPDEMLSAKELARVIFRFCRTSDKELVYPRSLTIASCRSGEKRAGTFRQPASNGYRNGTAKVIVSKTDDPLCVRVLCHLNNMFARTGYFMKGQSSYCTVAGPIGKVTPAELRLLSVPPTGVGWWADEF